MTALLFNPHHRASVRCVISVCVLLFAATESPATPGAETRDYFKRLDPTYEQMWRLLEISPLRAQVGEAIVRIWNDSASLTITAASEAVSVRSVRGSGDDWAGIVGEFKGLGKRAQNPEKRLETRKSEFSFADAAFALEIRYLLSRISEFDAEERGLDGDYTFVDAVDFNGKHTTFEVWSPSQKVSPLAYELCTLFDDFEGCLRIIDSSPVDWVNHEQRNFMIRFPSASSLNLTQAKARDYVERAFKMRLQNLVNELKRR